MATPRVRVRLAGSPRAPRRWAEPSGITRAGSRRWRRASAREEHVDDAAASALAELHRAVARGEQRVVAAATHVVAGMEPGASLAHDDGARRDGGAVVHLHTEALSVRVTPVAGGAAALRL